MLYRYQAILFIWALDAVLTYTYAAAGRCDDFVSPKETSLGISVIVILSLIFASAVLKGSRPRLKPGISGLALLLWVTSLFLSAILSGHTDYSLRELRLPVLYFLTFLSFLLLAEKKGAEDISMFSVAAAAGMLFALHGLFQYFGLDFMPSHSRYASADSRALHVYSLFGNPNMLADFLALAIPLCLAGMIPGGKSVLKKLFFAVSAFILIFTITLTGSRAAIIASAFSALFFFAMTLSKKNKNLISLQAVLYPAIIFLMAASIAFSTVRISGKIGSVQLRMLYWRAAVSMFAERPALGGGPGNYRLEYLDFQREYFETNHSIELERLTTLEKPGHPHSEYLNALADTGILGFLFFAAAVFSGIFIAARRSSTCTHDYSAWGASLLGFAILSFFGDPLRVPTTGVFLPISLAMIAGAERHASEVAASTPMPAAMRSRISKITLLAIIACAALYAGEQQFRPLQARMFLTGAKRALAAGQPDRVIELAEIALRLLPNDGETLFTEGAAYLQTGRAKEALYLFRKAKNTSADPNLDINISLAYADLGQMKRAIDIMKKVEKTIPADPRPKKLLAVYYLKTGRRDLAVKKLRDAEKAAPNDEETKRILKELTRPTAGGESIVK